MAHDAGMTWKDAVDHARKCRENVNVMHDPKTGRFHVIREHGVEHWSQHYKTIATIRMIPTFTQLHPVPEQATEQLSPRHADIVQRVKKAFGKT